MYKCPLFSTSSPTFVICRLFDDSHSDRCEVISHCCFDLHFSNNYWCWASFHGPVGHLYVFFGKKVCSGLWSFFDWLFGFFWYWVVWAVYIFFDINPLLIASFLNIFSHSAGWLFVLPMVLFAVEKLLNLIRSHLFIVDFISFALGDRPPKILLKFMSKGVLPMFSSRSFIVSCLTFRS